MSPPKYEKVAPYLFKNTDNGFFYVRKAYTRLCLPELFASTREKRKLKAQGIAEQMIADHVAKHLGAESSMTRARKGYPVRMIIDEILTTYTPHLRPETQAMHKLYFTELNKAFGSLDVGRITISFWTKWLNGFREAKKRKTFDDYVKHMNLILRYAYKHKYASHLITLPATDPESNRGRIYTHEEIERLWNVMGEDTRDQFVLSYECMMRLREVLHLAWDRINFTKNTITLRAQDVKTGSKTGRGRTFYMSPLAAERLKARYERRANSLYVFPSPTNPTTCVDDNKTAWIATKKRAKVVGRARWHDLRHTGISNALLEGGISPVYVSEYAGVSIRTIQRVYLHSTAEQTKSVSMAVSVFSVKKT